MYRKMLAAVSLLALAAAATACSTAQVQTACGDAAMLASAASPFLIAASPEVKTAVTLIGAGAVACGTPEYAAARGVVLAFLAQHGVKTP